MATRFYGIIGFKTFHPFVFSRSLNHRGPCLGIFLFSLIMLLLHPPNIVRLSGILNYPFQFLAIPLIRYAQAPPDLERNVEKKEGIKIKGRITEFHCPKRSAHMKPTWVPIDGSNEEIFVWPKSSMKCFHRFVWIPFPEYNKNGQHFMIDVTKQKLCYKYETGLKMTYRSANKIWIYLTFK